jgi:hypothetical protein
MSTFQDLKDYAKLMSNAHPHHEPQILDLVQLCKDEIEEGGSEAHEVDLAWSDIADLCSDVE